MQFLVVLSVSQQFSKFSTVVHYTFLIILRVEGPFCISIIFKRNLEHCCLDEFVVGVFLTSEKMEFSAILIFCLLCAFPPLT